MGKICQIIVIGVKGEKKIIDVANSEEEFNKTTVLAFKEKLVVKCPELKDSKIRIMFTDIQLQDTDTFGKHKLEHLSTVAVFIQLPGGGAAHTAG
ncbi:uncharacterized protein zgc:194655 [Neoarius graeffei]|uniref:uncharacterized protein zgc:194655 n=1 Tax=Neoarius graeffei TaxID=443677 RepID=UPI00298CA5E3|nr:uncharacterized protein zgc:194655 [Neoarius graeffei]